MHRGERPALQPPPEAEMPKDESVPRHQHHPPESPTTAIHLDALRAPAQSESPPFIGTADRNCDREEVIKKSRRSLTRLQWPPAAFSCLPLLHVPAVKVCMTQDSFAQTQQAIHTSSFHDLHPSTEPLVWLANDSWVCGGRLLAFLLPVLDQ